MTTVYSAYSGKWKPSGSDIYRQYRARLDYSLSANTDTYVQYKVTVYVNINSTVSASYSTKLALSGTVISGSTANGTVTGSCSTVFGSDKTVTGISTRTYTFYKTTSAYTKTFTAGAYASKSKWTNRNWVYASATITVPALASYTVNYDANGGEGEIAPQTKWFNIALPLSTNTMVVDEEEVPLITKEGWSVRDWNTMPSGEGTAYALGSSYTNNSAVTLYANWQPDSPPTATVKGFRLLNGTKAIKYFGKYVAEFNVTNIFEGRTATAKLVVGEAETTPITIVNGGTYQITSDFICESGELEAYILLEDVVEATTQVPLGTVTLEEPRWTKTFQIDDAKTPDITSSGYADITLYRWQYNNTGTPSYVRYTGDVSFTGVNNGWYITVPFTEDFVDFDGEDIPSKTPDVKIKIEYTHTDTSETESRKAFYQTTRNQNYSNGIYSVMFVGGVIPDKAPSYASRVWWCYINNPLYFPDTNYAEVGSNDTSIMGLCKVGDYLGAVKQSKTTDTAIYLLYPTSFDEETTFAQKQGIQGVGAIAKYSFNVLGDETLFLSPDGVMAIRPDQDENHKVLNRSFFVDGKLLNENAIEEAYSFVYGGMYWLSIEDHCYVLDGNQQSSWGNDKTNLVLECYYLENVPARCFMKVDGKLWFSNDTEVCRFKDETSADAFTDSYSNDTKDESVPVMCEWSTILDDDGSMHYLKTMQKKGNVVSILPVGGEPYISVGINEDEFNEDKTRYYILIDGEYAQCTEDSEFEEEETYYIINVNTSAEVYIKKDAEEPIFVGEVNGQVEETGDIPNELVVRKKIKKYKRLQFIIRNNKAEGLGIDNITKSYVVGNYVKK